MLVKDVEHDLLSASVPTSIHQSLPLTVDYVSSAVVVPGNV